jgi:predicted O-methyltransferase YrrM
LIYLILLYFPSFFRKKSNDYVFSDADKNWYKNYAEAVLPKLVVGGCITAQCVREALGKNRRISGL